MLKLIVSALVLALSIVLVGCGSNDGEPKVAQEQGGSLGNFILNRDLAVQVYEENIPGAFRESTTLIFPQGLDFTVLEIKSDPVMGELARLGIDSRDGSEMSSDIWVSLSEIKKEVSAVNIGDQEFDESLLEESAAPGFRLMKGRRFYCYRFVKQYLLKAGLVKTYLPGAAAVEAYNILPRYGFHKTGHSPYSAQNGEVCVYAGGPQGYGHIEVKRGGSWWYGYGYISHPMKNRRFLACFAK